MIKIITITAAIALPAFALSFLPANSQTPARRPSACVNEAIVPQNGGNAVTASSDLNRAKNLARRAAEAANGGLGNYRAEASMYGPATEAPCVDNGNGTYTFTFKGGKPGSTAPAIESVVTIDRNSGKVTVDYNGSIRSTTGNFQTTPSRGNSNLTLVNPTPPALARSQNLARQAAERANGGLGNYRAEASMYGPSAKAPVVVNNDGTYTFTFKGSRPGSTTPTIESVVTVSKDFSSVTVDYNGPVRSQR